MREKRKLLVIGAHSADFVWRAAGAIAVATTNGGSAHVVALSYGEHGESGELWKTPGQTVERVKQIRHDEATRAAEAVGASFECLDLGDYPLRVNDEALNKLVAIIVAAVPDVILTHTNKDPFNPDHPVAYATTELARQLASGAGVASAFKTVRPPEFLLFEPHQPDLCNFTPTTFVDITAVFEKKVQAMACMGAQEYLRQYYTERAAHRANHARRISGNNAIKQSEVFMRAIPQVVEGV